MSSEWELIAARSTNGVLVRLTAERWDHIIERHPEMATERARVFETVTEPDMIQRGEAGELLAVRFYPATPLTSKFLLVAYHEVDDQDGFIVTAFLARRTSARRITLWRR